MAIQYRKNVLNLTPVELLRIREAFERLYDFPPDDYRGYSYLAGLHGHPNWFCPHHNPNFLTWHRAYLYIVERALQEVSEDSQLMLPYWDWTAEEALTNGIPTVFTDPTYTDSVGNEKPNPLRQSMNPWTDELTSRDPSPLWFLERAARAARESLDLTEFGAFQDRLESGHDGIHGFVGGSMGQVNFAAFDPIFFFHHCNVDRLWAEWQKKHPFAEIPDEVLNNVLPGFSATGSVVIDHRALEFDYAASSAASTVGADIEAIASLEPLRKRFSIASDRFEEALLVMEGVQHPKDSLELRVFLNQPDASADSPVDDDHHFAGSLFLFGHGACTGKDSGHCDWRKSRAAKDFRQPHHLTPFDKSLDVTAMLKKVAKGKKRIDVALVPCDTFGDPLSAKTVRFERLSLVTRD